MTTIDETWSTFETRNPEARRFEPKRYQTLGKANAAAKGLRERYWYYETQVVQTEGRFIVQYRKRPA